MSKVSVLAIPFLLLLASNWSCFENLPPEPNVDPGPKLRAITLDSRRSVSVETLHELKIMGVTHLTLITFGWQSNSSSPKLEYHTNGRWYTESDSGITALAHLADSLEMEVIIKPHLWVRNERGGELTRDQIGFDNEADWLLWENSYRGFILHHASLSQRIGASVFVIGTELRRAARDRPVFWRSLIRDVRQVFDGQLTYAANWYKEYEEISFWDDLDFIGVQSYFPISDEPSPKLDDLKRGWNTHRNKLQRLSATYSKPILFTELGYRSARGTASQPWVWAPRNAPGSDVSDVELQASLYSAFFETFWNKAWFAGAIVWKWDGDSSRGSARDAIDFTPKGKPASDIIAHWFLSESP